MNAVGVFAGRGDVILAMMATLFMGVAIGWQERRFSEWLRKKLTRV